VYLGLDEFEGLRQDTDYSQWPVIGPHPIDKLNVFTTYPFQGGPPLHKRTFLPARMHAVTLYLVPWMRGILVVP
jgi:hypothetical protein